MEIQGTQLSMSETVDSDYVQILFEDESGQVTTHRNLEYPYLLLQRSFEMSGPYYLECRNHDLCGHGGIKRLALKRDGIEVVLNRQDLSLSQRTIRVHRKFTAEELLKVRAMLKIIVSGYRCFVDET